MDIVVSNRVARATPGGAVVGGLAAALFPAVKKAGVVWFGSSGRTRRIAPGVRPLVQLEPFGAGTIATIDLPEQHHHGYYSGFANSALWPLLHARPDLSRSTPEDFLCYREVNAHMARSLVAFGGPESTYWIHDYHFLPLARELRGLGVKREIGLFLHTPWPGRRIIAHLPQYRELIDAVLCYDLIGFQTDTDRDNFAELLRHDFGLASAGMAFKTRYGMCRIATFPIGIDTREFADSAQRALDDRDVQRLRASLNAPNGLMIGVDRVDYSKGLTQRVKAFERLLSNRPDLKQRLTYLQIAVPSRSGIDAYRDLQEELARLVGQVNGSHAEIDWTPIRYLNKSFSQSTLAGFYRASAIGLVTPLQDGMNLVAKEYVAAQNPEDPGVLMLSKYAGAACELGAALIVDPYDVDAMARQIALALIMPRSERKARWQHMMGVLLLRSIHTWFAEFMQALKTPEANVLSLSQATVAGLRSGLREPAVAGGS